MASMGVEQAASLYVDLSGFPWTRQGCGQLEKWVILHQRDVELQGTVHHLVPPVLKCNIAQYQ